MAGAALGVVIGLRDPVTHVNDMFRLAPHVPVNATQMLNSMLADGGTWYDRKTVGVFKFSYGIKKVEDNRELKAWFKIEAADVDEDNLPLIALANFVIHRYTPNQPCTVEGFKNQIMWIQSTMADTMRRGGFCTQCENAEPPAKRLRTLSQPTCGVCTFKTLFPTPNVSVS